MIKIYFFIVFAMGCLSYACSSKGHDTQKDTQSEIANLDSLVALSEDISSTERKTILLSDEEGYKVTLYPVLQTEYDSLYSKFYRVEKESVVMYAIDSILSEFNHLGVVIDTVTQSEDEYAWKWMKSIKAKNGTTIDYKDNDMSIVAYYPFYHLLLLEGGHASEWGVDVLTGESIDIVGNPASQTISPNKFFRLSSIWSGQECSTHVLQKNESGEWKRIAFIDNVDSICNYSDSFWTDNYTLYMKISYGDHAYFKMKILATN